MTQSIIFGGERSCGEIHMYPGCGKVTFICPLNLVGIKKVVEKSSL